VATTLSPYALVQLGSNRILDSLPETDRTAIMPRLSKVSLPVRKEIYEQDRPIDQAYFLTCGLASMSADMEDGSMVEVGMVGAEGFVGAPLLFGNGRATQKTFMQVEGEGFSIGARELLSLCDEHPALRGILLRFCGALYAQSAQFVACNRLHEAEERLARWLLMVQDRVASHELPLTHEFIAIMLGTRRSTVTIAAGILQRMGSIEYNRGVIHVLNRDQLQHTACECYQRARSFVDHAFE
jgi:CRP-like cAMP-binding protein